MRFFFFFLAFFFLISPFWEVRADTEQGLIDDPKLSRRCKELLKKRKRTIEAKNRVLALNQRAKTMKKNTPAIKKTLHRKLFYILEQLKQEKNILLERIQNMDEKVVRSGCPGVVL